MRIPKLSLLIILLLAIAALLVPFITSHKPASNAHTAHSSASKAVSMISNKSNVPTAGSLKFGVDLDSVSPASIERAIGSKLNLVGQFTHFNQNLSNDKLAYACQHSYVPIITWESWRGKSAGLTTDTYPLSDIAKGKYDSYLRQNLTAVSKVCRGQTIIIRFDQEPDTLPGTVSYTPWQGDPTNYIAAWKHIVGLSRSIDTHILWAWSPNRSNAIANLYYPGGQWVDYVGITLNRNTAVMKWPHPPATFEEFYLQNVSIEQYHKPVIIGETTATEDPSSPQFKADWIRGMFSFARQDKAIVGIVWFNIGNPYRYDSSPASVKAFKDSL